MSEHIAPDWSLGSDDNMIVCWYPQNGPLLVIHELGTAINGLVGLGSWGYKLLLVESFHPTHNCFSGRLGTCSRNGNHSFGMVIVGRYSSCHGSYGCVSPLQARVVHLAHELIRHRHLLRSAEAFRRGRFVPMVSVWSKLTAGNTNGFFISILT